MFVLRVVKLLLVIFQSQYPLVVSLLQFSLLAAFCLQLCLALSVYMDFIQIPMTYRTLKVSAMGWTVPMIVVGASLAAQVLDGFHLNSWWLEFRGTTGHVSNYFASF